MNMVMRDDLDFPYRVIDDTFEGSAALLDDTDYESADPVMDGFGAVAAAADEAALIALYGDAITHNGDEPAYVVEEAVA